MSDRWAVELASAISQLNQAEGQLVFGEVQSLTPLAIRISGVIIHKNIYMNPALVLENETKIEQLFVGLNEPQTIFLKQFHKNYVLKLGDIVIAFYTDTSVYILSKVVKLT